MLDVDPHARRDDDFYQTFRWTDALLRRCRLATGWKFVEPCAGNLAIARMFRDCGFRVWANDLVQRDQPLESTRDARDPAMWELISRELQGIDVAVTNLPFSEAFPIIQVRLEFVRARLHHAAAVDVRRANRGAQRMAAPHDWLIEQIAMPRANYRGTSNSDSATHH